MLADSFPRRTTGQTGRPDAGLRPQPGDGSQLRQDAGLRPQPGDGSQLRPDAGRQLRACIEGLYGAVLPALAHPDLAHGYRAIAGLSRHLAAMRRTVFPVARRQPGTGTLLTAACRAHSRQTEWALRRFECLLSGQSQALRLPPGSILAALEQRLSDYRAAELVVLDRLDGWLSGGEHGRLTAEYRAVLRAAPTRPHPRCPHTGPLAGPMFRMCALRDRVLDTVDSRPARPPAPPA